MLLPAAGFAVVTPFLVLSPIYVDELHWKLINSRLWLDGGKLIYLFPVCTRGFLLDVPISWYPLRAFDSLLFADMTNPQRLRYWGYGIFLATTLYASWVAKRTLKCEAPFLSIFGAVLAPLTLGALPFLVVFNRPEQPIVISLLIGCTLPFFAASSPMRSLRSWGFAGVYSLLAWTLTASHLKGIYFLPALLLAAFIVVRPWLPRIAMLAAFGFGVAETYQLWMARTDCPESPFLTHLFHSLSLSPANLSNGVWSFLLNWWSNLQQSHLYWDRVSFQLEYQSSWLPSTTTPLTEMETTINKVMPVVVTLGVFIVVTGVIAGLRQEPKRSAWVGQGAAIAALLLVALIGVAGLQIVKNFYEAGLVAPVLGLATLLALPSVLGITSKARTFGLVVVAAVAVVSIVSELALASHFSQELPAWFRNVAERESHQANLKTVLAKCGLPTGRDVSRIVVDDFAYTLLWRTREPFLLAYFSGWWGQDLDRNKLIRDRHIAGLVGGCSAFAPEHLPATINYPEIGFCCSRIGPRSSNER
jgi:hypothetical protein